MLMLMMIAGGLLYVTLDDKYFCIQPSRAQLGPQQEHLKDMNDFRIEDAEPRNPQTEEEESLFSRTLQHSEKDVNRDLIKNLENIKSTVPRRTIMNSTGSNMFKNNIMGERSCYAPSFASKSEIGENSERYSQRSNSLRFGDVRDFNNRTSHRNS